MPARPPLRRSVRQALLALALSTLLAPAAHATMLLNGDFSAALAGWTPVGSAVTFDAGNGLVLLENEPAAALPGFRSIEQTFVIMPGAGQVLSFDFAFTTASGAGTDSLAVGLTTVDGDFLDILVVDAVNGALPAPPPPTGVDVTLDPAGTIVIAPLGGAEFSGHVRVALPDLVLGDEATLYFELGDGAAFGGTTALTRAAVDNVAVTRVDVASPASLGLAAAGLLAVRRRPRRRPGRGG